MWTDVELIQKLFVVERKAKEARETSDSPFCDADHLALRRTESVPLIAEIRSCADTWSVEVLPRSAVGKAVGYMLNQWHPLTRFLDDPTLPLHNNA
ncbi:MAG: transposase, partial [Phycisphaerae bacterium]